MSYGSEATRVRREPPAFRRATVRRTSLLTPHMIRITLGGTDLEGLTVDEPAASLRLLIPSSEQGILEIPQWNGNEFLLPDGQRPVIRTFTPRLVNSELGEASLDIVIHPGGAVSQWAAETRAGDEAAISGPGRGYQIDRTAPSFLLAGDETAIPAISQLLEELPPDRDLAVHIEVAHPEARLALPRHPRATIAWHDRDAAQAPGATLVAAVRAAALPDGVRVWAAGEAAAMQQIRKVLFRERGFPREQATVRGYWKQRAATPT